MSKLLLLRLKLTHTVTFFSITVLFFLSSCANKKKLPDISNIPISINIDRFEQALFTLDSTDMISGIEKLRKEYPIFFELYIEQLLGIGQLNDTAKTYQVKLAQFASNPNIKALYDSCTQRYPKLDFLEQQLTQAFKYNAYYFPDDQPPRVVSHISEFGPAAVTYDNNKILGINLDMFLGKDFVYYPSIGLPQYIINRLEPSYITPISMAAYAKAKYPLPNTANRLIDQMIYEGQILYYLDLTLPTVHDTLKIGYTQDQLNWCYKNEQEIWAFLLENEWLFNGQSREFSKFINEAPYTAGMPTESPGKVGAWIGWQIVRKYMNSNPNADINKLMLIADGQELLTKSKYKPSRR